MNIRLSQNFGAGIEESNLPPDDVLINFLEVCEELFDMDRDEFDYCAGATKIVLTNFANVVYKFPYKGTFSSYNEDDSKIDDASNRNSKTLRFIDYDGASSYDSDTAYDYCHYEMTLFNERIPPHLQYFFAELTLHQQGEVRFYEQEKCYVHMGSKYADSNIDEEDIFPYFEDERDRVYLRDCGIEYGWLKAAIDYYGPDDVIEFIRWLITSDDEIMEDLHNENYGYTQRDNRPVIIDWGGYRH